MKIGQEDNKAHVALSLDVNDELAINSNNHTKKITISPSTYTKFKKHSSKRKSVEQKKKLQALLSVEKQDDKKQQFVVESDDEVVENCFELISEGVQVSSTKRCTPLKRVDSSGIRIGFCPKCNKLLEAREEHLSPENDLFFEPKLRKEQVLSEDEEEEFESISQIGSKPCKLKWPTLSDSEGELIDTQTTKNLSILLKNTLKSDRSDFFEMNNPTRKQCNLKFTEFNKKLDAAENLKVAQKSGSRQIWGVADADSETGDDRNEAGLEKNSI